MSNRASSSRSSSSGLTIETSKPRCSPSSRIVSSVHDWVAVTISPRLNISWTSEPGFALIFSAKSDSDAPRGSRTTWPCPRGAPELIVGADRLSNSCRF